MIDRVLSNDRFADALERGLVVDPNDGDLKGWRDMLWHYLASVAYADRCVGRMLDGLERSPYATNTIRDSKFYSFRIQIRPV